MTIMMASDTAAPRSATENKQKKQHKLFYDFIEEIWSHFFI